MPCFNAPNLSALEHFQCSWFFYELFMLYIKSSICVLYKNTDSFPFCLKNTSFFFVLFFTLYYLSFTIDITYLFFFPHFFYQHTLTPCILAPFPAVMEEVTTICLPHSQWLCNLMTRWKRFAHTEMEEVMPY
jgi:hypothetical protein